MSAYLQELVAYALVLAAAAWLGLRWRSKRARACSACTPAKPSIGKGIRARGLEVLP